MCIHKTAYTSVHCIYFQRMHLHGRDTLWSIDNNVVAKWFVYCCRDQCTLIVAQTNDRRCRARVREQDETEFKKQLKSFHPKRIRYNLWLCGFGSEVNKNLLVAPAAHHNSNQVNTCGLCVWLFALCIIPAAQSLLFFQMGVILFFSLSLLFDRNAF